MARCLEVIAGGKGTRIRTLVERTIGDGPKHLLPLTTAGADGPTILSAVIEAGLICFDLVRVHVREEAAAIIGGALRQRFDDRVSLVVDHELTGPLGPIARGLAPGGTMYFAGGDAYCSWDWDRLIAYHKAHPLPVTALFARTRGGPGGARITVSDEVDGYRTARCWERVTESSPDDLLNIGAYILDGTPEVLDVMRHRTKHSEDHVLGDLARQGLLAAYLSPRLGFNVNTQVVYDELLAHLTALGAEESGIR